jgi:hypothetical protein
MDHGGLKVGPLRDLGEVIFRWDIVVMEEHTIHRANRIRHVPVLGVRGAARLARA